MDQSEQNLGQKESLSRGKKLGLTIAFLAMLFAGVQAWEAFQNDEFTEAEEAKNTIEVVNAEKEAVESYLDSSNHSTYNQSKVCRSYRGALVSNLSQLRRWYTAGKYSQIIGYTIPESECQLSEYRNVNEFLSSWGAGNTALGIFMILLLILAGLIKSRSSQ